MLFSSDQFGIASVAWVRLAGSMPYFGPRSCSMSSCWLALSASRMPNAQSSISAFSAASASRTARRIMSTPKAAWRDSSCSTRRIISDHQRIAGLAAQQVEDPDGHALEERLHAERLLARRVGLSSSSSSILSVGLIG
jgi:hypothetical protein